MATSSRIQKVGALLRNPTVQKVLAWALPLLFGWILSKLETKSTDKNTTKKK
jgi:hypothetical protein